MATNENIALADNLFGDDDLDIPQDTGVADAADVEFDGEIHQGATGGRYIYLANKKTLEKSRLNEADSRRDFNEYVQDAATCKVQYQNFLTDNGVKTWEDYADKISRDRLREQEVEKAQREAQRARSRSRSPRRDGSPARDAAAGGSSSSSSSSSSALAAAGAPAADGVEGADVDPEKEEHQITDEQKERFVEEFVRIKGEMKDWLRKTILSGEMLEVLYNKQTRIRKRFYISSIDLPKASKYMEDHFKKFLSQRPSTNQFTVDIISTNAPGRSFAIQIEFEAFVNYVQEAGLKPVVDASMRQMQLVRAKTNLAKRDFDSEGGLPAWKKAGGYLTKFEILDCNIKEIRDYDFVKEIKPYLKHSDGEVKKKAQTIIKDLQTKQAQEKMKAQAQQQVQQQQEEELDELFGDD